MLTIKYGTIMNRQTCGKNLNIRLYDYIRHTYIYIYVCIYDNKCVHGIHTVFAYVCKLRIWFSFDDALLSKASAAEQCKESSVLDG